MTMRPTQLLCTALLGCTIALGGCGQPAAGQDDGSQTAAVASTETNADAASTSSDGTDNTGRTVRVHYRGTLEDGTQFDSSYDRGDTLEFTVGSGQMISGFDEAVRTMAVGEKRTVTLEPDEAYGERDETLVVTYPKSQVPDAEDLSVGDQVILSSSSGQQVAATVTSTDGDEVVVDANHELAGKRLTFEIELVEVED